MSKILIVEDNAESRYLLEYLLTSRGHQITAAENGEEALRLARQDPPDVIISDILMPVMDGFELCRKVRQDEGLRHIPFVVYTATYTGPEDETFVLNIGADRFIKKPSDPEALIEAIGQVMAAAGRSHTAPLSTPEPEEDVLKVYSERLVRKLELSKMQLEAEVQARRKAEGALLKEKRFADTVINSLPGAFYLFDEKGRFLRWNTNFRVVLGYSDEEISTMQPVDFFMGKEKEEVGRAIHQVFQEGESSVEADFVSKDGTKTPYFFTGSLFTLDDQRYLAGMGIDISRRKEMERALQESGKRFQDLYDDAPVGYFEYDRQGNITQVNRTELKMLGYTAEEMIGQPCWKFIVDEDARQRILAKLAGMRPPGRSFERTYRRKDGTTFPVLVEDRLITDEDGHIAGIRTTIQDITKRKRAEEALRESEDRYRDLVENSQDLICTHDLKGRILSLNPYPAHLLGYDRDMLLGMNIRDILVPERVHEFDEYLKTVGTLGEAKGMMTVLTKTGQQRVWEFSNTLRTEGVEEPIVRGMARDITERKRAEEALRKSEKRLSEAQRIAKMGDFTWDVETGEVTWSEGLYALLGYEPSETVNYDEVNANIHHPDDLARVTQWLNDAVASGKDELPASEYRLIGKDGGIRFIRTVGRIRHRSGEKAIIFATVQDIGERKQAEEEREKLQAQLHQAQKMESVGRLAGGVAHDFNNKLSVILGYTELAMEGLDRGDPIYGNLREVSKAGKHSVEIVRQLLAFARKQTIAPKVLDLNETVEGMLKMLRRLIGEDIDLSWQPDTRLWQVKMDPAQIDQILANLCINARDAIAGVGKVAIETENVVLDQGYCADHAGFVPGDYVMLAVSDDGMGMDKETLANAFEPFFTTKEVGKGTGLGLSTVYGIAKQNQGFVNVYSEPGKGTSFKIYLPRHLGEAEEGIEAAKTEIPRGHGETILVVEDEASVLSLARRILEGLGYAVLTSASPAEAVNMAREHAGEIHLLMTDVVLPKMSGRELAEAIAKIRPHTKTLFMSGYTANVIAHHGVLNKGVHFIQKPFTFDSLARKVREAMDSEE